MIRIHPAIIAQAAATSAAMLPGRFFLGVGTGENLNEHILGDRWPEAAVRLGMLEEAIEVIRLLWQGGYQSHHGRYYTVEEARIYTLPDELPPIYVAASKPNAAEVAGRLGDGLISTSPDEELIEAFQSAGGQDKPKLGQVTVCFADDEGEARKTAHEWWPNAATKGDLSQELPLPRHFEDAAEMVTEDDVAEKIVCGPDADRYFEQIEAYADAGFDHVYLHQVGPDQESFFRFAQEQLLPRYAGDRTTVLA
jgi:coenzyme F420-dependent glucose-6-phosphate dehydrogenase